MDDHVSLSHVAWGLTAATAAAATATMALRGLAFDWASAAVPAGYCGLLLAVMRFYTTVRPDARVVATLVAMIQLIVFTACGATLSYAVTTLPTPLWDATFDRWDQALGLDWRGYLAFVQAHPLLGRVEEPAYASIMPQMAALIVALGLSGRLGACRLFVATVILSGLVCITVPAAMPALGAYVGLQITPVSYDGLDVASGFLFVPVIEALRAGTLHVVSLHHALGLVTFPSYHAALGVIFAWGWSRMPWLRWPGIAVNLLLIASTPIYGGHYFVDVLAGFAVAVVSLVGLRALAAWSSKRHRASNPRSQPRATGLGETVGSSVGAARRAA